MAHIYGLTGTAEERAKEAGQIGKDVLAQHAADVDTRGRFPEESVRALAEKGFLGLCVPKALGGMGEGPRGFVGVAEELALHCGSSAMIFVMHVSAQQA